MHAGGVGVSSEGHTGAGIGAAPHLVDDVRGASRVPVDKDWFKVEPLLPSQGIVVREGFEGNAGNGRASASSVVGRGLLWLLPHVSPHFYYSISAEAVGGLLLDGRADRLMLPGCCWSPRRPSSRLWCWNAWRPSSRPWCWTAWIPSS